MRNIAIISVIFMAVIQVIHPDLHLLGIYPGCPAINHLTYMFCHASWLHLICNSWYFLDFAFRARSLTPAMWTLALLIAILMPSFTPVAVVGFSGVLYALSGFLWVYSTDKVYFGMIFIAMTVLQLIAGTTAVLFHVCCFSAAIAIAFLLLPVYNSCNKR